MAASGQSEAGCFISDDNCPDSLRDGNCFSRVASECEGTTYSDRYDDASATWVVLCAILMFFMKAGFLYLEQAFSRSDRVFRRRVVLAKYIDIFAGTIGFWLFGYAISGNTDSRVVGEEQDYIFWFFRFTFATNTATIIGGTLVGHKVQMRAVAIFVYSFCMTAFIHPSLARFFWSAAQVTRKEPIWSPYEYCNGTFTATRDHRFVFYSPDEDLGDFVFFDFAGSGLVHLCGGIGGLTLALFHKMETSTSKHAKRLRECCYFLRRDEDGKNVNEAEAEETSDYPKSFVEWLYPSGGGDENVESAALGILILWTTWFGFNAGSTESIAGKVIHSAIGRTALTMCLACASGGLTQVIVSGVVQIYKRDETFNTNEIANAVLGSLVAVTGCCSFIEPPWAILIGFITVWVYHLGCFIEYLLKIWDGARVFPVHGMCGFFGVLCVGIFSKSCLIRELYEGFCFCLETELPGSIMDQGVRFGSQLAGGLFIIGWSFVLCSIVFTVLWFFPVKFALTCLPLICRFGNEKRGVVNFQGNILFTHFNEIGAPKDGDDEESDAINNPIVVEGQLNTGQRRYVPPSPRGTGHTPPINQSPGDSGVALKPI